MVRPSDLPGTIRPSEDSTTMSHSPASPLPIDLSMNYKDAKRAWLDRFEDAYVTALLEAHDGNVSAAAAQAGMDRRSIQRILKRQRQSD